MMIVFCSQNVTSFTLQATEPNSPPISMCLYSITVSHIFVNLRPIFRKDYLNCSLFFSILECQKCLQNIGKILHQLRIRMRRVCLAQKKYYPEIDICCNHV